MEIDKPIKSIDDYLAIGNKNPMRMLKRIQSDYFFGEVTQHEAIITLEFFKKAMIEKCLMKMYLKWKNTKTTDENENNLKNHLEFENWKMLIKRWENQPRYTIIKVNQDSNFFPKENILFFVDSNKNYFNQEEYKNLKIIHHLVEKLESQIEKIKIEINPEIQAKREAKFIEQWINYWVKQETKLEDTIAKNNYVYSKQERKEILVKNLKKIKDVREKLTTIQKDKSEEMER